MPSVLIVEDSHVVLKILRHVAIKTLDFDLVHELRHRHRREKIEFTFSTGVADQPSGTVEELMHAADPLLYRAKQTGRNMVLRY